MYSALHSLRVADVSILVRGTVSNSRRLSLSGSVI